MRPANMDDPDNDLRRAQALELRVAGLTYSQIGAQVGVTQRAALTLVREAAANLRDEKAGEYRSISNERYNLVIARALAIALNQENAMPDRVRALSVVSITTSRQAYMNGCNAPDVVVVLSAAEQHAADEERAERLLADLNAYLAGVADATAAAESEAPEA